MSSDAWRVCAEARLALDSELQGAIAALERTLPEERRPVLRSLCRSCYMAGHTDAKGEALRDLERLEALRRANRRATRRERWRARWRAFLGRL